MVISSKPAHNLFLEFEGFKLVNRWMPSLVEELFDSAHIIKEVAFWANPAVGQLLEDKIFLGPLNESFNIRKPLKYQRFFLFIEMGDSICYICEAR